MGGNCLNCPCYNQSSFLSDDKARDILSQKEQIIIKKNNQYLTAIDKSKYGKNIGRSQTHRILFKEQRQIKSDINYHRVEKESKVSTTQHKLNFNSPIKTEKELPLKIEKSTLKKKVASSIIQDEVQVQRKQFLANPQLQYIMNIETNLQKIIIKAGEAHKLKCLNQSKNLYIRALSLLERKKRQFSEQAINQSKGFINSQLTLISISQKNQDRALFYFTSALENYKNSDEFKTVEDTIGLISNYSIFIWQCGHLKEAKQYSQLALKLQRKYFTLADDRLYLTCVNLACLCYQSQQYSEAQKYQKIIGQACRNEEIKTLAENNRNHYLAIKSH